MSQPTTQHENLSKFLSSHDHLKWLHDIERQSFYQVSAHEKRVPSSVYTDLLQRSKFSTFGSVVYLGV